MELDLNEMIDDDVQWMFGYFVSFHLGYEGIIRHGKKGVKIFHV